MSRDQGPGVSMFQGAENLSLEINGKSPEEEEDIEDDNRRKEELHEILKSAFDDLNTDDDSSVADSSHYSGASHPHETSTACENIQPSISPCEVLVDYNKVIEFESGPGDSNTSHFCRNTSDDSHQISSTSLADKSLPSSPHTSLPSPPPPLLNHSSTSTSSSRKKAKQLAKAMLQQHTQQQHKEQQQLLLQQQQELYLQRQQKEQLEEVYQQTLKLQQANFQQQQNQQLNNLQNHSPGGPACGTSPQQHLEHSQMLKFKQLEKQYEKRVREIEDLRLYIQQMDSKLDQEKSRMDKVRAEETVKQHTSEDEKKRVQVLEREIQELRGNVNTLVRVKENTSKELDVSKLTIYDLQQKIAALEQKKNVSKSMKSYERIIEQMKADYAKQEKYYQNVQTKVLSEFDRLKGELEKIRTEKDKMAREITSSVDFIRTRLLDDPSFDLSSLRELEAVEASDEECGFSVMRTLQQFLRMKQCDIIKSLKTCRTSTGSGGGGGGGSTEPGSGGGDTLRTSTLPNQTDAPPPPEDPSLPLPLPPVPPPPTPPPSMGGDLPSPPPPPSPAPASTEKCGDRSGGKNSSTAEKNPSRDKSPSGKSPASSKSPAAEQSARKANNNNLAELNSILLDRLKKRESQLKSMTLECLNMSEVHFDSMKDVMNDFVRYHFAESLRNVSKPPKDTSAESIAQMIDLERRKDDLLKEFLDNFRGFISDKKKEKLNQIREIQADFCSPADPTGDTPVQQQSAQENPDPPEDDKQLLLDLKKMKDSFVNEINHVREELIKLDKENEGLRSKCGDYEQKNKCVMEELASLKEQLGHQHNGDVSSSSSNNKKKGKSKSNHGRGSCPVVQSSNGTQTVEAEPSATNLSLPDSTKPEDLAKLEKSLDMRLMYEKNELLKALNRAHNEIKSKESLLQRMECDYYDKILEIEQHSVDLYAEEVHKIESARSATLLAEITSLKETLTEHVATVKKQKAEIRQLRLRDTILSMENERLNSALHDEPPGAPTPPEEGEGEQGAGEQGAGEEGEGEEATRVSAEKIDRIRYQVKFQQEYEKLRDVCRQWSNEVRSLRSRLSASEKSLDAFRLKYKSIRKSALAYKKLAGEREKRLAEEKETHRLQLDDIQFKMAKTVHKREAEINAKIAEIEKCNNEKLKVIMMMQRSAESGGGGGGGGSTLNNKSTAGGGGNHLNNHAGGKGVLTLSKTNNHKKCSNETTGAAAAESDVKNKVLSNGGLEETSKGGKKSNVAKVAPKVNNAIANNNTAADRSGKSLKKKKTEL